MERIVAIGVAVLFGIGAVAAAAADGDGVESTSIFSFADPEIFESSGLVMRDGLAVTMNDSGDTARIFTVDPKTGDTVGVTTWDADAVDIESLAPAGDGMVWVGDTGDNLMRRDSINVTKVPFGPGDHDVPGETYELVYPDGAHDAETLLADPTTGRLYVVAKEFIGRVYAAPKQLDPDGPNTLKEVGDVLGISTDGSFLPDGRHIVVRNYGQAAFYTWPALDRVDTITLPRQQQGEGLGVDEKGRIYLSSEGAHSDVLRISLPADLREKLAAPASEHTESPFSGQIPDGGANGAGTEDDSVGWWWLGGAVVLVTVGAVVWRFRD